MSIFPIQGGGGGGFPPASWGGQDIGEASDPAGSIITDDALYLPLLGSTGPTNGGTFATSVGGLFNQNIGAAFPNDLYRNDANAPSLAYQSRGFAGFGPWRRQILADAFGPTRWHQRDTFLRELLDVVGGNFAGQQFGPTAIGAPNVQLYDGTLLVSPDTTGGTSGTVQTSNGVASYTNAGQFTANQAYQYSYDLDPNFTRVLVVCGAYSSVAPSFFGLFVNAATGVTWNTGANGTTDGVMLFSSANIASTFYELRFKSGAGITNDGTATSGTFNDQIPGGQDARDANFYGMAMLLDGTAKTVDAYICRFDRGPRWAKLDHQFQDGVDGLTWPAALDTGVAGTLRSAGFLFGTNSGNSEINVAGPLAILAE